MAFNRCPDAHSIFSSVAALDLQEFSTEDRDMIMETLSSLKNTLEEALAGTSKPSKNLA